MSSPHPFDTLSWLLTENSSSKKETKDVIDNSTNLNEMEIFGNDTLNYIVMDNGEIPNLYTNANFVNNFPQPEYSLVYSQNLPQILQTPSLHLYNSVHSNSIAQLQILRQKRFDSSTKTNNTLKQLPMNNISPILTTKPVIDKNNIHQNSKAVMENTVEKNQQYLTLINDRKLISHEIRKSKCTLAKLRQCTQIVKQLRRNLIELYYLSSCDTEAKNEQKNYLKTYLSHLNEPLSAIYKKPLNTMLVSFVREHFFDMHSAFKETYLTQKIPTTTTTKKTFPDSLSQDKRLRDILGIKVNNNIVSSAVVAPGNGILMASVGTPYHIRNEFVDQKSCCAVQNRIDKFETAVRYIDRTLSSSQNSTSNAKQITSAVVSRVSSTNHQSSQSLTTHDSRDASFDALNRRRNRTLNPKYFAGPFYSPLYAAGGGGGGNSCFSNNQTIPKKDETDYQLITVDNEEGYRDKDAFCKDQAYTEYMPKILAKKSTNSIGKQQLKNFRGGIRMRGGPSTLNFGSRAHDINAAAANKHSHLPKNHRYGGGNNKNRPSTILTLKQKQMREQELRRKQEKLQQIRQIRRQKLVQRCWANWLLRGRSYKPLNFSIFSNSEFENEKYLNMAIPTSVYRNWMQTSFDFIGVIDYMDSREDNKIYVTKMVMKENCKELKNIVENEYDDPLSASDRQNLRIRIQQELTILNKLKALLDYDVIPLMPYDFTQSQLQYLSKLKELTTFITDNKKTIIADSQNSDVDDKMSALLLKHMLLTSSQINCTTESALQKSKAEKSNDLHDFEKTTNQTKNDTVQTVVTNTDTIEALNKNENKSLYEKPVTSVTTKAHWNYLTEEMDWLASDFAQESRWKASAARKVSRTILRYFEDKWVRDRKTETEEIARVKRLAARVSKQIYRFWRQIAKVVENKAHYIAEARMKVELDSQLNDIVGQTERYSNLITQQFAREHIHNPSTTLKQSSEHFAYKNDKKCDKTPIKEGTTESLLHPIDKIGANTHENITNVFSSSQKTEVITKSNLSPTKITPKNVQDNFDPEKSKDVREEKLTTRNLDSGIMITEETNAQIPHEPTHSKRQKTQTHSKRKKRRYTLNKSEIDVNNVESTAKSEETEEEKQEKMEREELEMNQIAEEALKFQPKGFTLDTTQVKTPVPFMLKHSMREYQHIGLDWLVALWDKRLNGILADEMGLGKTIQTIALLAHLACEKGNWGPHLIIVPTSVMLNWEMECKKWCPGFRILTYYGSPKERKAKRKGWGHGLDGNNNSYETVVPNIVITSYRLVLQDERAFRRRQWQYMILDEAQNIKNFRSQRWTSLLNFKAKARLLLTGTPLQNDLMEVWSLMHFLMPTVFREASHFNTWFAKPLEKLIANVSTGALNVNNETLTTQTNTGTDIRDILGGNMNKNSNHISNNLYNNSNGQNTPMYEQLITKLHKVLRPFILRRLKKQVERQLPGKFEHVLMCRLSKRQKLLYHDFLSLTTTRRTLAEGSFLGIMNILMQLRKVCNHPDLFQERPVESPFLFDIASADRVNMSHLDYTNFNNKELLCFNSRFPQLHDNVNNINQFCRPLSFLHYPTCILLNDTVDKQGFHTKWNPTFQHNSNLNDGNENNLNKISHGKILKDKDLNFTPRINNGFQIFSSLSTIYNLRSQSKFDTAPLNDAHKNNMKLNALIPYVTYSNLATFFRLSNMKDLNINRNFYDKISLHEAYNDQNFSITKNKNILNYMHLKTGTIRTKDFLEATQPYLDRFVIYTPKCMIQKPLHNLFHISHPIGHYNNNINNLSNHVVLNHEVLKKFSTMFNTTTDFYLKFPDRRLIEYDCGKLQQLKALLAQLRHGGHRALIFTQMTRVLDILEAFLTYHGYTYLRLDGSTRVEQRQILTERFNHDMRIFCFILSTRSGGLGLNLTGADSVIFYDSDWNPTMDAQAQDRCHRIGQTKPVHIYRLISQYTVEENILHKAKQKKLLGDITIEEGNFTTAYFKREGIQAIFNTTSELSEHGTKKDGNNQTLEREPNSDVQVLSYSQNETIKDELLAKKQAQLFEEALAITEDDIDSLAMRRAKQEDWEGKQREYLEFDFETTNGDNNDKHETMAQNMNENTTNNLIPNTDANETTMLEKIHQERIIDSQWSKVLKLNRHWKKSIPSDVWDFISQLKPIEKYCLTLFECLNFDQLYPDDASTNTMKTTTQQLDKRELKTHTFEPHFENESNQTPSLLPETSNQMFECTEQKLSLDVKGHKRKINHDSDESNNSAVIIYNDSNHSQANETSSDEI